MRIEKLSENKIRIFLNLEDLKEKDIDLHTFMSNSLETQDLFLDMLSKAETEVGFNTRNYRLAIEALASAEGNFILTITRIGPDSSSPNILKPKTKRQSITPNKRLSIYSFSSFDDFCEFCNYINEELSTDFADKLKTSSLILFKNTYYLIFNNLKLSVPDLKSFSCLVSEFASRVKNEELLERKLKEHGKIIFPKNAIFNCLKYFSNTKNS